MQMRLELWGGLAHLAEGAGAWLEGEDQPGGAEPSAVEQHIQILKRTSAHGGQHRDRKEASQLSLSKPFTWEARKHLLGLRLEDKGLVLVHKGSLLPGGSLSLTRCLRSKE